MTEPTLENRPRMDKQGIVWRDETHTFKLDHKKEFEKWFEGFEKKFRDLLRVQSLQVWIERNLYYDITFEESLRFFIEKEILGDSK